LGIIFLKMDAIENQINKKVIFIWLLLLMIVIFIIGYSKKSSFISVSIYKHTYMIGALHLALVLCLNVTTCLVVYQLINHGRLIHWMTRFHMINTSVAFLLMIIVTSFSSDMQLRQSMMNFIFLTGFIIALASFSIFCINISFSFSRIKT
jgi:hypothetical protein